MPRALPRLSKPLLLALSLALTGCGGARPLSEVDAVPPSSGNDLRLYYVTDRNPSRPSEGALIYTASRSSSMALGMAHLHRAENRAETRTLPRLAQVHEALRFPATPLPFSQNKGVILPDSAASAQYAQTSNALKAELSQALRDSGQNDVLLYVHGFNSSFAESIETLARVWRSADQGPVPLAYSWPAGNPGLFGYFKDRESGEFSIYHLKETLRLITATPGVARIHIIAHSRGSDVVTTALREAAPDSPRRNLIHAEANFWRLLLPRDLRALPERVDP